MASDAQAFKPIHSLVLDTGPLIKNDPPANTLRAKAEQLYTLPSIISEIRDAATRSRVETTLLPFITLRSPNPESVKVIRDFARRTGDLAVLSKPDIDVLALGYELECERNGGDWRLRKTPGQKGVNGKPNKPAETEKTDNVEETKEQVEQSLESAVENLSVENPVEQPTVGESSVPQPTATEPVDEAKETPTESTEAKETTAESAEVKETPTESTEAKETTAESAEVKETPTESAEVKETPTEKTAEPETSGEKVDESIEAVEEAFEEEASDDEGGWITPSNLKKHQAASTGSAIPSAPVQKTLQAAVLTSDYAMQNVALRMNLNLVAPSLARITHLKNWVLRCHGCFQITKDMNKQFCPSCGQSTLIRTSCSTDEHGNFKVHLKRNFQWNNRGNVYSVPKPVHGSANGRLPKNAGGKNGWGNNLILTEDQKEFTRASDEQRRQRKKDIMDQDYLPDLLTGHRSGGGGKIRVGAGRNVNSKRKH